MHKRDRIFFMNAGPGGPGSPGDPAFGDQTFTLPLPGPGHFGAAHFGPRHFGQFGGRGRRRRRGNVRAAILLLLADEPRNGYQLMQELEARSGGAWRPSPGSVYPALQLLADEGLVRAESRDGANVYELTDAGRAHIEEHREALGTPWEEAGADVPDGVRELMRIALQVGIAARQVAHAGTAAQAKEASEILANTRRALYRILAEE